MNFIAHLELHEHECWFQQDGVKAHTANSTMQMSEFFGGRIISRNLCPPPDPRIYRHWISVFGDFFNENLYNFHRREELKQNTELCISDVTSETLHLVAPDMRRRVNACIAKRVSIF
jgi:hypothetical protein